MLSSTTFENTSDLRPFGAMLLNWSHQHVVLLSTPIFFVDLRIQVIQPSLSALSVGLKIFFIRNSEQVIGYYLPFHFLTNLELFLNYAQEQFHLIKFPCALRTFLRIVEVSYLILELCRVLSQEYSLQEGKFVLILAKTVITNWGKPMLWMKE